MSRSLAYVPPESSLIQGSSLAVGMNTSGLACAGHETCVDPELMDIEAYSCDCYDFLDGKSDAEINMIACDDPIVCCRWKDAHCSSTMMQSALLRAGHRKANNRQQKAWINLEVTQPASMEQSLTG